MTAGEHINISSTEIIIALVVVLIIVAAICQICASDHSEWFSRAPKNSERENFNRGGDRHCGGQC